MGGTFPKVPIYLGFLEKSFPLMGGTFPKVHYSIRIFGKILPVRKNPSRYINQGEKLPLEEW